MGQLRLIAGQLGTDPSLPDCWHPRVMSACMQHARRVLQKRLNGIISVADKWLVGLDLAKVSRAAGEGQDLLTKVVELFQVHQGGQTVQVHWSARVAWHGVAAGCEAGSCASAVRWLGLVSSSGSTGCNAFHTTGRLLYGRNTADQSEHLSKWQRMYVPVSPRSHLQGRNTRLQSVRLQVDSQRRVIHQKLRRLGLHDITQRELPPPSVIGGTEGAVASSERGGGGTSVMGSVAGEHCQL